MTKEHDIHEAMLFYLTMLSTGITKGEVSVPIMQF